MKATTKSLLNGRLLSDEISQDQSEMIKLQTQSMHTHSHVSSRMTIETGGRRFGWRPVEGREPLVS